MATGLLALEDGTVFRGEAFGARGTRAGEVCFNTSMTGYQEILTDPSYKAQIVALTYPQIGNYGVNTEDVESCKPHVSGFVVRELSPVASNWRSSEPLADYLQRNGIPGLCGIDTRALTKILREKGALKGILSTEELSDADAIDQARQWEGLNGVDHVCEVTCREPYVWDEDGSQSRDWFDKHQLEGNAKLGEIPPAKHRIVAYDFGIKYNILRRLRQAGFSIELVPARTPAEEVLKRKPDGIFLSNGPGDPSAVTYAHENVKQLIGKKPIFGICLGHQILTHAMGGETFKLKFGHRGGNQPVKDLRTGKITITSQNHGYAVHPESLPADQVEITHINLNDGTCEGMALKGAPVFSVQYHPEAAPGPHDANYFFEEFSKVIDSQK